MAHSHAGVDATTAASGAEHQKRLMMSLGLTSTVFIAEVVSAIVTGSLALLVDAGHMLTDMSVLIASTVTAVLMQRKPSNKRTWGWARLEVLTAAVGALVLLIVGIYALVEAGMRLFGGAADEVHDVRLLLFMGILGLAANVGSIFILAGLSTLYSCVRTNTNVIFLVAAKFGNCGLVGFVVFYGDFLCVCKLGVSCILYLIARCRAFLRPIHEKCFGFRRKLLYLLLGRVYGKVLCDNATIFAFACYLDNCLADLFVV